MYHLISNLNKIYRRRINYDAFWVNKSNYQSQTVVQRHSSRYICDYPLCKRCFQIEVPCKRPRIERVQSFHIEKIATVYITGIIFNPNKRLEAAWQEVPSLKKYDIIPSIFDGVGPSRLLIDTVDDVVARWIDNWSLFRTFLSTIETSRLYY